MTNKPCSPQSQRRAAEALCGLSLAFMVLGATAAEPSPPPGEPPTLEALNRRINDQIRRLAELRRTLDAEEVALQEARRAVTQQMLSSQSGGRSAGAASLEATDPKSGIRVGAAPSATSTDGASPGTVVAPIFEESGVLTPTGHFVLEPSVQYGYSSNNRVTLLGYTIIPALVVGLVDVREVKRNTLSSALSVRYGVSSKLELEARAPYIYRSDNTRSRPFGTGSPEDIVVSASGRGIGDVELAARYQLTNGSGALPIMIGSLRVKSRTGTDPFEVVSDCAERCAGNTTGTGQPLQLPTGSGFYSIQPGLTWLLASDPAVLFGSFSYLHSIPRNVERRVLNGEIEPLGRIAPGDVLGFNVGIGLALNEKSSFSVGYDHSSIGVTKQNGVAVPGSVRTQLGTLLFGYSYKLDDSRSLNFSVGAGLTADTPGITLGLRMPVSF